MERTPKAFGVAHLLLVRPMNTRALLAVLTLVFVGITARAQDSTRMLMYTFQDGTALIHVGFIDTPRAPRGFVLCPTSPRRQKGFSISHQQFEQVWLALHSSGAEKFAGTANRTFDAAKNYVFSVAHMPNGSKTNFVVPKTRASGALIALARQFEAYAR
jgi:hypothetical protein